MNEHEALREVAQQTYVGWQGYYKTRNINVLLSQIKKVKELLEQIDMWHPREEA